jgi:flagellar biosynthesis protein FlhB
MARAAEQATYEPTSRRLAEARRRGDVAQSRDLRNAVALAATGAVLIVSAPATAGLLRTYFAAALAQAARGGSLREAAVLALDGAVRILAAPLAVAFATPILVGLVQTGGLWIGAPRADLRRLAPGRSRAGTLAGLVRGALAVALLLAVAVATLAPLLPRLVSLAGVPPARAMAVFGAVAQRLGLRLILAALAAGIADELWGRVRHRQRLRMTRSEIERERKEVEGDPLHRQARRREQQRLQGGSGETIDDLRKADLVVTGGEGDGENAVAVALAYDPDGDRAPVVVAAGRRAAAAHLIDGARAAGVAIVGDAALAGALFPTAPGVEIPAATFEAVAQLLHRIGVGRAAARREMLEPPSGPHGASGAGT